MQGSLGLCKDLQFSRIIMLGTTIPWTEIESLCKVPLDYVRTYNSLESLCQELQFLWTEIESLCKVPLDYVRTYNSLESLCQELQFPWTEIESLCKELQFLWIDKEYALNFKSGKLNAIIAFPQRWVLVNLHF